MNGACKFRRPSVINLVLRSAKNRRVRSKPPRDYNSGCPLRRAAALRDRNLRISQPIGIK
jgi:hypothetical protein